MHKKTQEGRGSRSLERSRYRSRGRNREGKLSTTGAGAESEGAIYLTQEKCGAICYFRFRFAATDADDDDEGEEGELSSFPSAPSMATAHSARPTASAVHSYLADGVEEEDGEAAVDRSCRARRTSAAANFSYLARV